MKAISRALLILVLSMAPSLEKAQGLAPALADRQPATDETAIKAIALQLTKKFEESSGGDSDLQWPATTREQEREIVEAEVALLDKVYDGLLLYIEQAAASKGRRSYAQEKAKLFNETMTVFIGMFFPEEIKNPLLVALPHHSTVSFRAVWQAYLRSFYFTVFDLPVEASRAARTFFTDHGVFADFQSQIEIPESDPYYAMTYKFWMDTRDLMVFEMLEKIHVEKSAPTTTTDGSTTDLQVVKFISDDLLKNGCTVPPTEEGRQQFTDLKDLAFAEAIVIPNFDNEMFDQVYEQVVQYHVNQFIEDIKDVKTLADYKKRDKPSPWGTVADLKRVIDMIAVVPRTMQFVSFFTAYTKMTKSGADRLSPDNTEKTLEALKLAYRAREQIDQLSEDFEFDYWPWDQYTQTIKNIRESVETELAAEKEKRKKMGSASRGTKNFVGALDKMGEALYYSLLVPLNAFGETIAEKMVPVPDEEQKGFWELYQENGAERIMQRWHDRLNNGKESVLGTPDELIASPEWWAAIKPQANILFQAGGMLGSVLEMPLQGYDTIEKLNMNLPLSEDGHIAYEVELGKNHNLQTRRRAFVIANMVTATAITIALSGGTAAPAVMAAGGVGRAARLVNMSRNFIRASVHKVKANATMLRRSSYMAFGLAAANAIPQEIHKYHDPDLSDGRFNWRRVVDNILIGASGTFWFYTGIRGGTSLMTRAKFTETQINLSVAGVDVAESSGEYPDSIVRIAKAHGRLAQALQLMKKFKEVTGGDGDLQLSPELAAKKQELESSLWTIGASYTLMAATLWDSGDSAFALGQSGVTNLSSAIRSQYREFQLTRLREEYRSMQSWLHSSRAAVVEEIYIDDEMRLHFGTYDAVHNTARRTHFIYLFTKILGRKLQVKDHRTIEAMMRAENIQQIMRVIKRNYKDTEREDLLYTFQ